MNHHQNYANQRVYKVLIQEQQEHHALLIEPQNNNFKCKFL